MNGNSMVAGLLEFLLFACSVLCLSVKTDMYYFKSTFHMRFLSITRIDLEKNVMNCLKKSLFETDLEGLTNE